MIARPFWTQRQFEQYVEIALATMAKAGILRTDAERPALSQAQCVRWENSGALQLELAADFTPVGLPSALPISARTVGDTAVVWTLGDVPLATIPAEWTPEEAGEALTRERVRAAYRQCFGRGSAGRSR